MRHSKIFYVPSSLVVDIFRNEAEPKSGYYPTIPKNAVVRSAQYIKGRDVFMFVVDHDSFDSIPEGELLPHVLIQRAQP